MTQVTKEIDLYQQLLDKYKDYVVLSNVLNTIYWDMETYMPKKGIEQRSEEIGFISGLIHDRIVDPEIGSLLIDIKAHNDYENLSPAEKRTVYLIQKDYDRETKIPKELVTEMAKQTAKAVEIWKEAKKDSNFDLFKPELKKNIELVKKQAHYLDPDKDPYDVMLDIYEPGFTREIIDSLFSELRDGLVPLIKACTASPKQPDMTLIERKCPIEIQKQLSNDIAKMIKYDLERGRIDETVHPFTNGYYDDVRITTRYNPDDFTSSFFAVLHEGGHGLYEQNLPRDFIYQPIGYACSMGIHESQSRFIENIIGRSKEFWEFYLPRFKEVTGTFFADVELEPFVHAVNQVIPSKIRVHADPVTYSLHIILRYEIEKGLFDGTVSIDELPQIWNVKMKEYLGIDIENDAEGVLQDTHWAGGSFGYFPDYALGNIYDGQLLWFLTQDIPDWRDQIKQGIFSPVIDWLIANVQQKGNLYDPLDLIKEITGEELTTKYYLDYLNEEYSKFYKLQ